MHMTQMAIGTTFLAGVLHLAVSAVVPRPPPIVIDRLEYSAGFVEQTRTVTTPGKFTAVWEARVVNTATGMPFPGCEGRGDWDYSPGSKVARLSLQEWVGSETCTLTPGQYQLFARYRSGNWATDARSDVFEVVK